MCISDLDGFLDRENYNTEKKTEPAEAEENKSPYHEDVYMDWEWDTGG